MATSFGYRTVDPGEKQRLVNDVFATVAERYDLMNDLMSGGLHRLWKDDFVAMLSPPKGQSPFALLDVAGGTGDIAIRALKAGGQNVRATLLDINPDMLGVGRERIARAGLDKRCDLVVANAESLPFADKTFDAYTIAFGIRNVPRIDLALKEAYRVLRPGGRFLCLEFSEVDVAILDRIYDLWSFEAIPRIGALVTGQAEPYRYLVESIRKFPRQEIFRAMIAEAGFARTQFRNLTGGIAAIHSAWRI
jgi:demethylmenaquinone methyltransferase/2-methoxy-6-polyprenyl-1,4-benzoquinol methylase